MSRRLDHGGSRIDRSRPIRCTVDDQELDAFAGDTLASAMLANDMGIVATGIYSGRPRGVMGIGAEEPNAFVQVVSGPGEPMVRATELEVYDGLAVRRLAGRGALPDGPDDSRYDKTYAHVDVLVVGGGPAGLAAAIEAGRTGGRVMIVDDQPGLGGVRIGRVDAQIAELDEMPEVRVLTRTTVTGYHDHNHLVAVERRTEHLGGAVRTDHLGDADPAAVARRRIWHIHAGEVVLATGAQERPIVFCDNDRPGVMLAGAAADYAERFGVLPGSRAVVWTAHDGGLYSALALADAGVELHGVLDTRDSIDDTFVAEFAQLGITVRLGTQVTGTDADDDGVLNRVYVADLSGADAASYDVDLLAVSGGLNPAVQLFSQSGGTLTWSDNVAGFVPSHTVQKQRSVGGAAGSSIDGWRSTRTAPAAFFCAEVADGDDERVFLDPQRDATLHDLRRAQGAGLTSVEHIKRFTTIGTAADQGRGFGVLAVGVLAHALGRGINEVGTTTYRPPYTPLSFGLLAGRDRDDLADPIRVTAIHDRHVEAGAPMEDVGQWKRPWYFPQGDESIDEAVLRECNAVRTRVGMMDASTLGKIILQGSDVGAFLDRIYTNMFSTLKVGKVRYGLMCGPDGMVIDDGTTARLTEDQWMMTTTTGNAAPVLDMLEEWRMTEWTHLDVRFTSVTEQWAVVAVAGPRSRDVLAAIAPDLDVSAEAFGFMDWRDTTVAGLPARIMRISFSGELAYEIDVVSWYGIALWDAVIEAGQPYGITPYGTETMHVLRAEKGFAIVGQDTDGTVTPHDLGMSWAVSKKKADFIGMRSLARADSQRPERRHLVGLVPVDGTTRVAEGAQLVASGADLHAAPVPMFGHVTSSYHSAALGTPFALALLDGGRNRHGEILDAVDDLVPTPVRVTGPAPYDPEGERRDG